VGSHVGFSRMVSGGGWWRLLDAAAVSVSGWGFFRATCLGFWFMFGAFFRGLPPSAVGWVRAAFNNLIDWLRSLAEAYVVPDQFLV